MLLYVRSKRERLIQCVIEFSITFYSLALNTVETPNAGLFVESTVILNDLVLHKPNMRQSGVTLHVDA